MPLHLCATVIHRSKGVVSLLSGCVPNFELDSGVVEANRLRQKRSPNRGFLELMELTFGVIWNRGGRGLEEMVGKGNVKQRLQIAS